MFYWHNPLRPLGRIVEYATFFLLPPPCGNGLRPAPSFAPDAVWAFTLLSAFILTPITLSPALFCCMMGGWWRVVGVVAGRARRPCCSCWLMVCVTRRVSMLGPFASSYLIGLLRPSSLNFLNIHTYRSPLTLFPSSLTLLTTPPTSLQSSTGFRSNGLTFQAVTCCAAWGRMPCLPLPPLYPPPSLARTLPLRAGGSTTTTCHGLSTSPMSPLVNPTATASHLTPRDCLSPSTVGTGLLASS